MRGIRSIVMAATVLALPCAGRAEDGTAPDKTGLAIGAEAPSFALKDQKGNERTLDEFLKKGKVALVFYRSASW